ncbi:hypothetical protein [Sphingomonas colocasiae]|uniref:Uncharacterized protein n=1 Tax=Sphingomonas colocasiae TaxID=1848973 RepID=A0ABS7PXL9_9SPHN|nr:hypothetical protein [Sphingomonas colocasiae]MBY8826102.1 hypothetical protein [Sphingomonas colocasiae]
MSGNYYPQSDHNPQTITVGDLIAKLQALDPSKPVIFKSPENGAFGSNTTYALGTVAAATMEEQTIDYPPSSYIDDETGEQVQCEAWTQVFHAWDGVILS